MNLTELPKLPKQSVLKDWSDPKSPAGDCWRCCIAAVTGIPASEVPHFLQLDLDSRGTDHHKDMDSLTQKWLLDRGFMIVRGEFYFDYTWDDKRADYPVIACGPSPRSQTMGQYHAVVYVRDRMVYDPHPSDAGLTAICTRYIVIKI